VIHYKNNHSTTADDDFYILWQIINKRNWIELFQALKKLVAQLLSPTVTNFRN